MRFVIGYAASMARGLEKHQERLQQVSLLGKDLARRAGRRCEWCEESNDLRPYDTAPDQEPELNTLALMCERCREVANGREDDPRTLRFLEGAVWNEVPAVSNTAKQALQKIDAEWARSTLEMLGDV